MIKLEDPIYFDLTTRGAFGRQDADDPPTFDVYENDDDTPVYSGVMTKRVGYTGRYRGKFECRNDLGFEAGKWYNVVATGVVDGTSDDTVCATFLLHVRNIDDLPTASSITTMSPLSPNGRKLNLKAGDAYLVSNGNAITFSFKGRPNIAAVPLGRMLLGFGFGDDAAELVLAAVSKTSSADLDVAQSVTFEMTSDDSLSLLDLSPLEFTFEIAYGVGQPSTIVEGPTYVTRRRTV